MVKSIDHLFLVSREELDLLSAVQVPQSDCEIIGGRHQQSTGQRMEPDGVNLFCVACETSHQLSAYFVIIRMSFFF